MRHKILKQNKLNGLFWGYIVVIAFVVLPLMTVLACTTKTSEVTANLGQGFTLKVGQTASIAGEDLKIKFVQVVTDSRCPTGATCIWAGEASCLLEVTLSGSTKQVIITQPGLSKAPSQSEFSNYTLSYNIQPYPVLNKQVDKSQYTLSLRVDKQFSLSGGILVAFDVVGENYSIFITNKDTIEQIFAVESGSSMAKIPNGRLIKGSVFYNEPWSWHIDSEDIEMAEITAEILDGTPSQVENNLDYWVDTVKRFGPWNAKIVGIQDFR